MSTWVLATVAAAYFMDLDLRLAALLGAVLVVTGPTVIGPLLRHIKPARNMGAVIRWEGIVVDPDRRDARRAGVSDHPRHESRGRGVRGGGGVGQGGVGGCVWVDF